VITIEDGCKIGGFGTAILEYANEIHSFAPVKIFGIEDVFIEQGTIEELHEIAKIDILTLKNYINNLLNIE
jgi:1-deoxy-D-xylulose-5-phosphate synthase